MYAVAQPQPMRRAVGVVRVSKTGQRKQAGDRFVSPIEQEQRIRDWCAAQDIELVGIRQELDVSGRRALARRPGLLPSVEDIEHGQANLLVVAYFDRLVRSLATQSELLDRVEAAGGSVVALDVGTVSTQTSGQWLSATVFGLMAEYYSRVSGEKTARAKADAVARGVPPFPTIIPGYRRGADGRLVVEPAEAAAVHRAFELRARGASVFEIRDFLHGHGIERSYRATQTLLRSRIVLGEIKSGTDQRPRPPADRRAHALAGGAGRARAARAAAALGAAAGPPGRAPLRQLRLGHGRHLRLQAQGRAALLEVRLRPAPRPVPGAGHDLGHGRRGAGLGRGAAAAGRGVRVGLVRAGRARRRGRAGTSPGAAGRRGGGLRRPERGERPRAPTSGC
jgi:DNA invertase Pin-like site-specific DNA recombinase